MIEKEIMSAVKKRLSLCLKGNHFTGVSEEGFSVELNFPNAARYNEWALNFESWKSQVAVEESFPHNVLLTDDLNYFVLAFLSMLVILLVVTNGRLIILSDGRLK